MGIGVGIPVAVLLREDGRVEAVFADPFISVYSSEGLLLPFLEDVVSLDVAMSSGDGRGDPSIYATCADGLRYDLQYLFSHTYVDIFDTIWSCEVETANARHKAVTHCGVAAFFISTYFPHPRGYSGGFGNKPCSALAFGRARFFVPRIWDKPGKGGPGCRSPPFSPAVLLNHKN